MDKFEVDLSEIQRMLDKNRLPIIGNEHRMVRVAFDLFRLKGDEADDLWQVQSADDGEFLVRTYSLPEDNEVKTSSDWSVSADGKFASLTVSYRGVPIKRLDTSEYGAKTPEDGKLLQGIVFNKLATDNQFVHRIISSLEPSKIEALKSILANCGECEEQHADVIPMDKKLEYWKKMPPEEKSETIPDWDRMPYYRLMEEIQKMPVVTPGEVKVHPTERQQEWVKAQELARKRKRKQEQARQWAEKIKKEKTIKIGPGTDPLGGLKVESPFDADDMDPVLASMEERLSKKAEKWEDEPLPLGGVNGKTRQRRAKDAPKIA
jgi:hypothetical protein